MTTKELNEKIDTLNEVFDLVRVVDVAKTKVVNMLDDGQILDEGARECFNIWNKGHRCENCISSKAYISKGEISKFEFRDDCVYFVVAKYIEVEGKPYIMEMGKLLHDKTLFGAYGKNEFIDKIISYNKKIYVDALTGCYNRRYFEEQLIGLENITAIAMMDIDNFKEVNDSFGHVAGDTALKTLARVIMDNVRSQDSVIRLGGDEFIIVFQKMKKDALYLKLEDVRRQIENAQIDGYPALHITTSIGGCYFESYHEELLEIADRQLYKAKESKNCVVVK